MGRSRNPMSEEAYRKVIADLAESLKTPRGRAKFEALLDRIKRSELRAKLTEAERYAIGRKGSPDAQGGLPSLGKRRP